jgi:hypothetical protein
MCSHPVKLRATNVSVVIGADRCLRSPGQPIVYDEVVFCNNPLCEKVFKSVRAK